MRWLVTAAYSDAPDGPQVYETQVEADTEEQAELEARRTCVADNGGEWPEDSIEGGCFHLADLFARPATLSPEFTREEIEDLENIMRDELHDEGADEEDRERRVRIHGKLHAALHGE